jgi:hypothetical protein
VKQRPRERLGMLTSRPIRLIQTFSPQHTIKNGCVKLDHRISFCRLGSRRTAGMRSHAGAWERAGMLVDECSDTCLVRLLRAMKRAFALS